MKRVLPLLLFMLPLFAMAQVDSAKSERSGGSGKNIIKVNLSSIALRNYYVQYERQLTKRLSLNLGFRYMPEGGLPLESTIRNQFPDIFDNDVVDVGKFTAGNIAITPELRLYLGKKGMKGFYIAAYGRYASWDLGLPLKYTYNDPVLGPNQSRTGVFNGTITSFSGGLMFGTQFNLGKNVVLDIWWLGGHYGGSNGDLDLVASLPTQQERDAVRDVIDSYRDDIPIFEYERVGPVTASGAKIRSTGPWAGIRGLGINLGIRF